MTKQEVVDDFALSCGRTPGAVAPIPQITSLDPGRPTKAFEVSKAFRGIATGKDASNSCAPASACVSI